MQTHMQISCDISFWHLCQKPSYNVASASLRSNEGAVYAQHRYTYLSHIHFTHRTHIISPTN